jgi:hypothetical protein
LSVTLTKASAAAEKAPPHDEGSVELQTMETVSEALATSNVRADFRQLRRRR